MSDEDYKPDIIKKNKSITNKLLRYFAVASIAALTYILLETTSINKWFQIYISNRSTIIITKALIIFTTVYIVNQIVMRYCFL